MGEITEHNRSGITFGETGSCFMKKMLSVWPMIFSGRSASTLRDLRTFLEKPATAAIVTAS